MYRCGMCKKEWRREHFVLFSEHLLKGLCWIPREESA